MNTFGDILRLTTFGESHGPAIGGVLDGCPAGLHIDKSRVGEALRRRSEGDPLFDGTFPSHLTTPRKEMDEVEWLSGMKGEVTMGTPIAFLVRNSNVQSNDYDNIADLCRPGHADYTYQQKYGIRDASGGGRASARETVGRVIAGAIALQLIESRCPIQIKTLYETATTTPDDNSSETFGGYVACHVKGLPAGWGEPLFGKLNARLSAAMMSIPSATGFEMGSGCRASMMKGSEYTDQWVVGPSQTDDFEMEDYERQLHRDCYAEGRLTLFNHCGGVQGGISNGDALLFRVHFHPVSTQNKTVRCKEKDGTIREVTIAGRHDRCQVVRAPIIVESMTALVLADLMLRHQVSR